jgi:hypothetical protein
VGQKTTPAVIKVRMTRTSIWKSTRDELDNIALEGARFSGILDRRLQNHGLMARGLRLLADQQGI